MNDAKTTRQVRHRRAGAAVLGSLVLLVTGCTSGETPTPGRTDARAAIDARSYYENYTSPYESDGQIVYGQAAPDAAAPGTARAGTTPDVETSGSPTPPEPPRVPAPDEDNTFAGAKLSGFVDPEQDAESTFALDVDNGSFNVARTLLDQGYTPPKASVRVEEWVNAMPYDYAAPHNDLGVDVGQTTVAGDERLQLLRLGIQARDVRAADRAPVNVTLVVDVSGSMDIRDRLGLVQSSLALLAKHLKPTDTVAVVTYDSTARPLLPPTPIRNTSTIIDAVKDLTPGDSTNLAAGLKLGYREARKNYQDQAVNAVVLCSDGVANVGVTSPRSLASTIQEGRNDGIHLVTVGYGMGNYNDHLMEQLADQGDGFYRYVDSFQEAHQVFVHDLTGTLTPVADEAKAQVTFDPEAVASYRQLGYDNRAIADDKFTDPAVDAGEIGAGQSATALYEIQLAPGVQPGDEVGSIELRWVDRDGKAHSTTTPITAADVSQDSDPATELAATAADLAQVLKHERLMRERGITLAAVEQRARGLADRGVAGADELVTLARQAQQVR